MTTNHENDAATDDLMDTFDDIDDVEDLEELESPIGDAASVAADALESGTLPLIGGGLALAAAIRSMAAKRRRAIPLAIVGTGLVGFGLSNRRSSGESGIETGMSDIEGGTEGKETSDEASAAAERVDSGRESEIQSDGEISAEPGIDDPAESGSAIDFTEEPDEDESRSRPISGRKRKSPDERPIPMGSRSTSPTRRWPTRPARRRDRIPPRPSRPRLRTPNRRRAPRMMPPT